MLFFFSRLQINQEFTVMLQLLVVAPCSLNRSVHDCYPCCCVHVAIVDITYYKTLSANLLKLVGLNAGINVVYQSCLRVTFY